MRLPRTIFLGLSFVWITTHDTHAQDSKSSEVIVMSGDAVDNDRSLRKPPAIDLRKAFLAFQFGSGWGEGELA